MLPVSTDEIIQALREMGELLFLDRKVGEIVVYGGAAILLQFEATFRTHDVDVHVESGDHGAVMQAAHAVAQRRGWLRSWLSEAVITNLGSVEGKALHASYPSETRVGLRVYAGKPDYVLAMKLRSLGMGSRDGDDAVLLARITGIRTFEQKIKLLRPYFPKALPDPRRCAIVGQLAETLHARPPDDAG